MRIYIYKKKRLLSKHTFKNKLTLSLSVFFLLFNKKEKKWYSPLQLVMTQTCVVSL